MVFKTDGTKLHSLRPWDITTLKLLDTWRGSGRGKLKREKMEVHMKWFMIVVSPQSDYEIWLWNLSMKLDYEIPGLDNFLSCFVNSFTVLYQWCMNEWICFDLKLLPNNNTIYTIKSRRDKYKYDFFLNS